PGSAADTATPAHLSLLGLPFGPEPGRQPEIGTGPRPAADPFSGWGSGLGRVVGPRTGGGAQARISTGVPRGRPISSTRRVITSLWRRMQPLETSWPILSGSLVPWMPITPWPPLKDSSTLEKPFSPYAYTP